jgi:hypothetical protein
MGVQTPSTSNSTTAKASSSIDGSAAIAASSRSAVNCNPDPSTALEWLPDIPAPDR